MKKLLAGLAVSALVLFTSAPADARGMGGGMGMGGMHGGMAFGGPGLRGGPMMMGPRAYGFAPGLRGGGMGLYGLRRGAFINPAFRFRRNRFFFPGAFAFGAPFAFGGWGGFGGGSICQNLTTGQIFSC